MIKFEKSLNGRFIANGDRRYFSPERLKANKTGDEFDAKLSDSYSVGLALWEIVTGENIEKYRQKIDHEDEFKVLLDHPILKENSNDDNTLEDLVLKMLNPKVNERWDIEKALNHKSLQNGESHDEELNKIVISYLSKFIKSLRNNNKEENDNIGKKQEEKQRKKMHASSENHPIAQLEDRCRDSQNDLPLLLARVGARFVQLVLIFMFLCCFLFFIYIYICICIYFLFIFAYVIAG